MKITVVHQFYLFPGQPGGSRFNELARLWTAAGHEVTVIAGSLNYTTGEIPPHLRGKTVTRQHEGGVQVYRCHVPPSYSGSYLGRMWAFAGFTGTGTTAALLAAPADVVIATSPPLTAAIPGWAAAHRGRRIPWIFEIRDLWPESAVTTGVLAASSPMTHALYRLEAWACRRADRINVLTPAFADDLVARGLAPRDKIAMIPNGADLDLFSPGPVDQALRAQLGWGSRYVVLYAGAHGRANALTQLIEAADCLRHRDDIFIACVGDGPERAGLVAEVERRGLSNIAFHGPRPKEEMPRLVNSADAGAAVLQNNPTFRTVYPNKVFDYLACAKPVLMAIDGVGRHLVCEQAQAGVFATPEDGGAIAGVIEGLASDRDAAAALGAQGRSWVEANASRDVLAGRYVQLMEQLVR